MKRKQGDKLGWHFGIVGSFSWVIGFAVYFLFSGKPLFGIIGLSISSIAFIIAFRFSPWKYPDTKLYKFMVVPLILLTLSVFWLLLAIDIKENESVKWYNFIWMISLVIPIFTYGQKSWNDLNKIN